MLREIKSNSLKYLIGGNPCGGTSYVASFLSNNGYPCGHEFILPTHDGGWQTTVPKNAKLKTEYIWADVNYTISEWCHKPPMNKVPIIMITRNPIDILSSRIAQCITKGEDISPNDLMDSIVDRYQTLQNTDRVVLTVRIEDELALLCDFLNVPYNRPFALFTKKHNKGRISISWDDIKKYEYTNIFKEFSSSLGY